VKGKTDSVNIPLFEEDISDDDETEVDLDVGTGQPPRRGITYNEWSNSRNFRSSQIAGKGVVGRRGD